MQLFKDTATETRNAFALGMVVQLTLVIVVVGILALTGIYIAEKVSDKTALTASTAATGTFTFSGNVSNGELVNITNGAAVYRFEFNTTANGSAATCLTANCIIVNLSQTGGSPNNPNVWNTSVRASGNLTAAINANTTVAALLTAANTTNVTTLTADTTGTGGNGLVLADNAANVASSGLSGGINADTFKTASDDAVDAVETGFDFLEIIILAIVAGLVILAIFSYIPIRL